MNLEELKIMNDLGELRGLFPDIDDSVYHHPEAPGKSSSFFKSMIKETPLHAITKLKEHVDTDAMVFGRACHLLAQDKVAFAEKYTFAPEGMRRDPRAKAYQDFLAANNGKTILSFEDWKTLKGIERSFDAHPLTKHLHGAKIEHSGFWTDQETGVLCKIRPDFFIDGVVYDLKTSAKGIDQWSFEKTIHDFGYHISSAMYLHGLSEILGEKLKRFVIIAVEKSAPFEIVYYDLTDAVIEKGMEEFRRAILLYAQCESMGVFPGYAKEFTPIGLPAYAWGI